MRNLQASQSVAERQLFTQDGSSESDTTLKYLSLVLPNQPDSGDRRYGRKTHLVFHQLDDTWKIVGHIVRRIGRCDRSSERLVLPTDFGPVIRWN